MLNALIPVFALILLGGGLRYLRFPGEEFWRGAERITYYLLFPSLLFLKLSTAVTWGVQLHSITLLLLGMLLLVTMLIVLTGYIFNISGATFTSLYQGGIRFNTYVGLAVVSGLSGDDGLAIAAMVVGVMIPAINMLCISVFAYMGGNTRRSVSSIVTMVITNPLILACAAGLLWNSLDWEIPGLVISVLELLSAAALPLGLLAVGAGVHIGALRHASIPFFLSSAIKLFVMPTLAYILCLATGQEASVTVVIVIIASLPTASSAYILARELGGDSQLMAAIITGQTLLAMVSMPVAIYLVRLTGSVG